VPAQVVKLSSEGDALLAAAVAPVLVGNCR
jgi:hypothetical protein